jgi:hypothetical protein
MNYERMGELLAETAFSLGWPNDGHEGAQEYVLRVCREVALEDAERRRGFALKRYVLFGGYTYYASGGWRDMQDSYADLESAWAAAQELMKSDWNDWWQIVDVNSGLIVNQSENQAHA